jgi:hypothetical protein
MLAIILELLDGLEDIVQSTVAAFLYEAISEPRAPTHRKFLDATDIQITIMQESFKSGHVMSEEPPILADTISA